MELLPVKTRTNQKSSFPVTQVKQTLNSLPHKLPSSWSMNTELRSDEADCGGVGVFGEVGTEADGGVSSGSISAMLLKVILCGGSRSRATGWPFSVPEVEVRTGRIPGDFSGYTVFLGCGTDNTGGTLDSLGRNP